MRLFVGYKNRTIWGLCYITVLVIIDQFTKVQAVMRLKSQPSFVLIPGILQLHYIENYGAAWGMLSGRKIVLILIPLIVIGNLGYLYYRIPDQKRYRMGLILELTLISGAIGNLLDRIFRGYVVDYIYVSGIDFPIFNVADCYVCIPIVLLLVIYRKDLMEWMKNG